MCQQGRNLLMDLDDAGARIRFPRHDRDRSFCTAFDHLLVSAGIEMIRTGVKAPRQNATMERWFRSLRAELTDPTLIWNVAHLRCLLYEYETFYNSHRPHRALDQAAPLRQLPDNVIDLDTFRIRRVDRARRLLHEYQQIA